MHRFYFHLYERNTCTLDEEGHTLSCSEAALAEAILAARAVMADEVKSGRLCLDCRIEIINDVGIPVATVPFTDALKIIV